MVTTYAIHCTVQCGDDVRYTLYCTVQCVLYSIAAYCSRCRCLPVGEQRRLLVYKIEFKVPWRTFEFLVWFSVALYLGGICIDLGYFPLLRHLSLYWPAARTHATSPSVALAILLDFILYLQLEQFIFDWRNFSQCIDSPLASSKVPSSIGCQYVALLHAWHSCTRVASSIGC